MTSGTTPAIDRLVLAGHAITMTESDDGGPYGPVAIGIRDGSITHVVSRDQAHELVGPDTDVLDLGDRVVLPGFVDPHAHLEVAAKVKQLTVDVRAPGCEGISDVLDQLRSSVADARGGWVVGQGNLFFDKKLMEGRFPTREELDSVSKDVAIAVRAGGHITILNSRAMELTGINAQYVEAEYSVTGRPTVMRDAGGNATGVVKEMDLLIPFPELTEDELAPAIEAGLTDLYTRYGVTSLGEIAESREGLRHMSRAHAAGRLGTRVFAYLWVPGMASLDEACDHASWLGLECDPGLVRVQGVKVFADGGYSSASAAVSRPYQLDGHGCGHMAMTREQVTEVFLRAAEVGLQLAIHANGDRAQLEVCAALAAARDGLTVDHPRPRIEHAGNFLPDYDKAVAAYAAAGILPVPQPGMLQNFGEFMPDYLGDYAWDVQYPFRRLLDDGWSLCASSDVWVGSEEQQTNPFYSISCCVNRRTFHGKVLSPDQAITVDEALRMHTLAGAEVMGEADTRGSIEVGKLADLAVLDRDPRSIPSAELPDVQVDHVLLEGRTVFDRPGAQPVRTTKGQL